MTGFSFLQRMVAGQTRAIWDQLAGGVDQLSWQLIEYWYKLQHNSIPPPRYTTANDEAMQPLRVVVIETRVHANCVSVPWRFTGNRFPSEPTFSATVDYSVSGGVA